MIKYLLIAVLLVTAPAFGSPEEHDSQINPLRLGVRPGEALPVGKIELASNVERPVVASAARPSKAQGKLVVMEFSDLECSDSAQYSSGLKSEIINRLVTPGTVEYQFHDFPLDAHPNARVSAAMARCAGDKVGAVRAAVLAGGGSIEAGLRSAGVDPATVSKCMTDGASLQAVDSDVALGRKLGVRATPTLVVGYRQPDGTVEPIKTIRPDKTPQTVVSEISALLPR